MSETTPRHHPFHCGTQCADWETANCENCHSAGYYVGGARQDNWLWVCDLQEALSLAFWGDGSVSEDVAQRLGYLANKEAFGWRCSELRPIRPEAEYLESLRPPPTRLAPLWWRAGKAWAGAYDLWTPWWRPEEDIYGEPGRLPLSLTWRIGWQIWHDARWPVAPRA